MARVGTGESEVGHIVSGGSPKSIIAKRIEDGTISNRVQTVVRSAYTDIDTEIDIDKIDTQSIEIKQIPIKTQDTSCVPPLLFFYPNPNSICMLSRASHGLVFLLYVP